MWRSVSSCGPQINGLVARWLSGSRDRAVKRLQRLKQPRMGASSDTPVGEHQKITGERAADVGGGEAEVRAAEVHLDFTEL